MSDSNSTQKIIQKAIDNISLITEKMKIVSENLNDIKDIVDGMSNPKSN
tara:strand:- start:2170 stop:2316 length:147 start_codon:yes stop_codon:yes gene_type:complete